MRSARLFFTGAPQMKVGMSAIQLSGMYRTVILFLVLLIPALPPVCPEGLVDSSGATVSGIGPGYTSAWTGA